MTTRAVRKCVLKCSAGARELEAPKYNCKAPCLMLKRKQHCIFIHSMYYAHACVYVCTYTQDKHNDKVLQSSNSLLHNLNCYTHYIFKL